MNRTHSTERDMGGHPTDVVGFGSRFKTIRNDIFMVVGADGLIDFIYLLLSSSDGDADDHGICIC